MKYLILTLKVSQQKKTKSAKVKLFKKLYPIDNITQCKIWTVFTQNPARNRLPYKFEAI